MDQYTEGLSQGGRTSNAYIYQTDQMKGHTGQMGPGELQSLSHLEAATIQPQPQAMEKCRPGF